MKFYGPSKGVLNFFPGKYFEAGGIILIFERRTDSGIYINAEGLSWWKEWQK